MNRRMLLLALLVAAPAAPADARLRVLGSSLRPAADQVEAHGADSAFWPTAVAGRSFRVPADGQVMAIRLKGRAQRSPQAGAPDPLNEVHFQSLAPAGDGRQRALLSSGAFYVPIGGRRNQVTTYRPENLCAVRGGAVAFNDEGGFAPPWYADGVRFQVFASVRGSRTARYTADNGTNNGDVFTPTVRRGSELLLQYVLATGRDVGVPCRNWLAQH